MFLFSCDIDTVYNVPEEVKPYIRKFEYESSIRGFNYKIQNIEVFMIEDSIMSYAAAGISTHKGRIKLKINKRYWDVYKEYPYRMEAILFHEFGHYPLMRGHNKIDTSLMNENLISNQIFLCMKKIEKYF